MSEPVNLNLGCGRAKIPGFINVDCDPASGADLIHDLRKKWPFEDRSVDSVVMYHTIEHISKKNRLFILAEIHRVLKIDGQVTFSYPEFLECVKLWETNHMGMKDFWEKTIYGAQRSASDFHVAIMHTPDFQQELITMGFEITKVTSEPKEPYNTVLKAKSCDVPTYEDIVVQSLCQPV